MKKRIKRTKAGASSSWCLPFLLYSSCWCFSVSLRRIQSPTVSRKASRKKLWAQWRSSIDLRRKRYQTIHLMMSLRLIITTCVRILIWKQVRRQLSRWYLTASSAASPGSASLSIAWHSLRVWTFSTSMLFAFWNRFRRTQMASSRSVRKMEATQSVGLMAFQHSSLLQSWPISEGDQSF